MTDYNGTMTYSYDELGRMTSKARGSYSASYGYQYDDRMTSVVSTFPGDPFITSYDYGGDGLRRSRIPEVGDETWYNWAGFSVINEEDYDGTGVGDGTLNRTYIGNLGDIAGSNPATGTERYYTHDHRDNMTMKVTPSEKNFTPLFPNSTSAHAAPPR